jgi:hypothetical protein
MASLLIGSSARTTEAIAARANRDVKEGMMILGRKSFGNA